MKSKSQEQILFSLVQDENGAEWADKRLGWNLNGVETGEYDT